MINKERQKQYSRKSYLKNKDKIVQNPEYKKEWYIKNRDKCINRINKHRARMLGVIREYGLTEEQYYSLPDYCEICGSKEKLHIDHDHKTQKFRGRLCQHCNWGLGQFKDNPDQLRLAINYLERKT